jgi:hypothetical protein
VLHPTGEMMSFSTPFCKGYISFHLFHKLIITEVGFYYSYFCLNEKTQQKTKKYAFLIDALEKNLMDIVEFAVISDGHADTNLRHTQATFATIISATS